ncbi:MAG: acetate/propionate family kinase, partial [Psychromonas sp.]|nr:acetate/propionate family kinase [Psychromonas sp.]
MTEKLILVLNCGSSSLKFAIINSTNGSEKLSGVAECLHLDNASIKWKMAATKGHAQLSAGAAHDEALDYIVNQLLSQQSKIKKQLIAIGHRVVHGGEKFTCSVLITEQVIEGIEECVALAPLHNPAHLIGIRAAQKAFSKLPNVAVFDTAFHQSMPEQAYLYALPYRLYKDAGIRRYGMHGTSHYYISLQAAEILGKSVNELNIINCHLGNGGSVCAIKNGKSVDTSMGMTPLEGLVMGTRCGDIDAAIIFHLHD